MGAEVRDRLFALGVGRSHDAGRGADRSGEIRMVDHWRRAVGIFDRCGEAGMKPAAEPLVELASVGRGRLIFRIEADGEFAEQLFVHGLGVQTAEGMAEWLHWKIRNDFGIPVTQGRRWSWGYPACPDQAEHEKLFRVLGAESIGLTLSGGHAVEPEQSTVAIASHHPQAIYFSMKQGRLVSPEKSEDEVIRDT